MNIFIDIETIPSGEPIDPATIEPPGNISKAETIAAWRETKAPVIAIEKFKQRALDSMAGEILCISYAIDDNTAEVISPKSGGEGDMLDELQIVVKDVMGRWDEPCNFVGWNIRTFDVPFIWRKAIKYELTALKKSFNRDRGRGNIIDLMEIWGTDFRDMRKQGDVASFLGLVCDDTVKGKDVYDLYLQGNLDAIISHCKADVETVREIYRRVV